ncbi:MAG TPA: hypothetical protein VGC88_08020 [Terriglobales bacterium]
MASDDFNVDRFLQADRLALRAEVGEQLASGAQQRLLRRYERERNGVKQPRRNPAWVSVAGFALLLAIMVPVVKTYMAKRALSPTPEMAGVSAQPSVPEPISRTHSSASSAHTAAVRARRRAVTRSRRHPFPTPVPLTGEEAQLVQLAHADPEQLRVVWAQQQRLDKDFELGAQEFRSRFPEQEEER